MNQMKLFDDTELLQLPADLMDYVPGFFTSQESDQYLNYLIKNTPWQQHTQKIYEKVVVTPRLSAWYGDTAGSSENKMNALAWTSELLEIKSKVEEHTGITFSGVLLNYYRDGKDSVAWHSDKDTVPGRKTEIASVSFGQERNFDFRNKVNHQEQYAINLESGSLLLMKGDLQKYWEHRIAKSSIPLKPRINLTFRIITT